MKLKFTIIMAMLLFVGMARSQEVGTTYEPIVSQSAHFDVSRPLREIAISPKGASAHHQWKNKLVENKFKDKHMNNLEGALPKGEDPSWQKGYGPKGITPPVQNFEGTRNSDNGLPAEWLSPPDTDGDVGPDHYFQMCNVIFQIFDKSGTSLLGPLDNSTIWDGFVGDWTGTNDGDPIILYDEQADRWLVSQFAVNTSITGGTYWILVAISTTGDPTGSYYRYAFQFTSYPDYPKFGIWRDGYYIMVQHGTAAGNVTAASFNRSQMIAGNATAQMVSFPMPNLPGGGFIGMLPSDNDGAWAPAGTPNYFAYFSDNAWGDDPVDRLKIWEFHVNWATPALSTLSLVTNLDTNPFDSNFGSFFSGWITQPGTTQKLAVGEGALMNRMQYRNFGTYQSMLCCHTVDVNGANRAGVRWYELRRTSGAWSIYQQGTYSPGTADNYWMASIAQNGDGDIALGFSVSSTSTYPSIKYTGRNAGDALGLMTLTEQTIYAGAASQYGTHRWGDYSMMSVDPTDDKTFWYTNEYINSSTEWSDWVTRIASFSLGNYCAAAGGCEEYISNVQIGTINNSSDCNGYADYTNISTDVILGVSSSLTVTNGAPWSSDQCGVWVDYNNDGDFNDANETIAVSGSPGMGPYTASVNPPAGTSYGNKTMRIRITYAETPSACGTTPYGEVEDYTIKVVPYCSAGSSVCDEYISRVQLGTIDNSTGCTFYGDYTAISTNFGLTATKILTVTNGNPVWTSDQCGVWIDWNRDHDFYDANETISVSGSPGVGPYTASISPPAGTTAGPTTMRVRITYNETPSPCGTSSYGEVEDYTIMLNGPNYWTGAFNHYWHNASNWSLGHIPLADEDVYITNVGYQPVYVDTYVGTLAEECKTLTIQSGGALQVWGMTLNVNGNLAINIGGSLTMTNAAGVIDLKGNWTESAGASGFTEGPGRVIFSGPGHQYIYGSENFNILEAKMGAALRLNLADYNVSCNQYDYTSGGIDIIAGTFTALDLADNGLFGTYWVNPGGTLNLTQDAGQWTDLHGEVHMYGGTMTVTGGNGASYWPYATDAIVEMSNGVLDFRNNGIFLYDGGNLLTENITGGTIKTNMSFTGSRTDFNPAGGTIELYGTSDAYLSLGAGSTLRNVVINKAAKAANGEDLATEHEITSEATVPSGREPLPEPNTKSNTVLVFSDLNILGSLSINAGTLDLNSWAVNVSNDVSINAATLKITSATDKLTASIINWNAGSNDNINNGEIHVALWNFNDGTNALLDPSNTAFVTSGINTYDADATFGNLVAVPVDNFKFGPKAYYPLRISGYFTIQNGASWQSPVDVYVNGVFDIQNGASFSLSSTNTMYLNSPFVLNGSLDVSAGNVLCHGTFSSAAGSILLINGGSFIVDAPYHFAKGWEFINGNLTMPAGLFEITHNSINLGTTATTAISGGALRTGGAFNAETPGTFLPTGGVVEVIGSDTDNAIYCGNGNYFYNLLINRSSGIAAYLVGYDILIKSNLTIQSGIFNSHGQNITIEGNWTNNVGPDGFVEGTNTVTFSGTDPKDIITNETFNNLVINKTWAGTSGVEIPPSVTVNVLGTLNLTQGTMQLDDNSTLNIAKDITFALNAGINAASGPGINISVGGNWTNNNTAAFTTNSSFFGGTSTVTFNGSTDQTLNTSFTSESFYNLNVNKSAGLFKPNDVLKIGGNIQVINGEWSDLISGLAHELSGNLKVFAAGKFYPKGNFTFTGGTNTTFENLGTNNSYFVNARLNKTLAANTLTQLSPVQLLGGGTLIVDKGTLNLNGNYFRVVGSVNINNGGKIAINGDAWLEVGSAANLNVNTGGTLEAIGTVGHPAKVTHHTGFYTFNVNSGGTISANNALFEYTGTINGLNVKTGATVNATNCFHNCTFQNGDPSVANAALLTIDNNQTFTVNNASFPAASTAKNVAKNINAGHVTFNTATGAFAGAAFEKDPNNLIDWYTPTLSASPLTLNVNPPAGTTTFNITSNLAWTVAESSTWFSVNTASGSNNATITVTFDQNTTAASRTGNITISAAGVPNVTVAVVQAGATLSVLPVSQNVTAPAGTTTFNVTSNTAWTVAETTTWFSVLPMSGSGNGTLTVTYTQNASLTARSGQITVSSTGLPNVVVTVNQAGAGATLTVLPANRTVTPPASTTTFSLTSNTGWAVSESVPWLSVLPMSGTGNGTLTVTYNENATGSSRVGNIAVTATGGSPLVTVTVTQASHPTQSVDLIDGWQGLSSYIMPSVTNLPALFTPVAANFNILQNLSGIYYPSGGINTIGSWASQSAYSIKMNAASTLPIIGPFETNKTFALGNGWNLMPVICNTNVTTSTLVSGLGANLGIIKEIAGSKVYWPAFGIYTLNQLTPGKAYYVRMTAAGLVTFPANAVDNAFIPDEPIRELTTPWNEIHRTAGSHIIGIPADALVNLSLDDIIGIFTPDGICTGNIQLGNTNESLVLYAFADDMLMDENDGFTDGQPMIFKLFRPSTGEEFSLEVTYNTGMPNNDGLFATEGISVIKGLSVISTGLTEDSARSLYIYPNPTNGKVIIGGIKEIEQILVMASDGSVVMRMNPNADGNQVLDLSALPAGFYQIQIRTSEGVTTRKVVKSM